MDNMSMPSLPGFPASGGFVALTTEVREYLNASLSENSRRAYCSDLAHFIAWGGSVPANPEQVAAYLAAHAGKHRAATLARRLVSIGKAHLAQDYPSPTDTELVRATLRGIRDSVYDTEGAFGAVVQAVPETASTSAGKAFQSENRRFAF